MTSCRFSRWRISAILDFRGPIIGSLRSPCTISYRSSIETIVLNCLVFEKNRVFVFWRPTDEQTNRWTGPLHEAALAVASGGFIIWSCTLAVDWLFHLVQQSLGDFVHWLDLTYCRGDASREYMTVRKQPTHFQGHPGSGSYCRRGLSTKSRPLEFYPGLT